jgi:hypothetical protein
MLAKDAFLRRLPGVVDGRQAVQIDALVFSADAIEASMRGIRGIAAAYMERIVGAPHAVQVEMFVRAWSVVDCVHVVRQTLAALEYGTPLATAFIEKYACARRLRNGMDHLSQNAANAAKSKGTPPIFGALGYVCVPGNNVTMHDGKPTVSGCGVVVLALGPSRDGAQMPAINPTGRELRIPVSAFQLAAFDEILELEQMETDLRRLMAEVNTRLEAQVTEQVRSLAKQHGLATEKLLESPARGLSAYLKINFDAPEQPTPRGRDSIG